MKTLELSGAISSTFLAMQQNAALSGLSSFSTQRQISSDAFMRFTHLNGQEYADLLLVAPTAAPEKVREEEPIKLPALATPLYTFTPYVWAQPYDALGFRLPLVVGDLLLLISVTEQLGDTIYVPVSEYEIRTYRIVGGAPVFQSYSTARSDVSRYIQWTVGQSSVEVYAERGLMNTVNYVGIGSDTTVGAFMFSKTADNTGGKDLFLYNPLYRTEENPQFPQGQQVTLQPLPEFRTRTGFFTDRTGADSFISAFYTFPS